jgi:N-acetylglucosamine kinase-like BadF-type ATPase
MKSVLFLGVDAGGSKTLSIVADQQGTCLGVGLGGTGNFQVNGTEGSREEIRASIDMALANAGVKLEDIAAAYCGVAGADREQDFRIVRSMLEPVFTISRWDFENDASIGIWAGTGDGVGVGVICGAGTNVLGFNGRGGRVQIGGMGYLFGDYAGGRFLATLAIRAAMRGFEGRGIETSLYPKLCQHYGISHLLDLVDWQYEGKDLGLDEVTPILFEAASEGDKAAQQILTEVGRDLGISANAAIRQLFSGANDISEDLAVKVVAMGSVFQKAEYPLMYDTFVAAMREEFPKVQPSILHCEPVFGAIYAAAWLADVAVADAFKARLKETFPGRPEEPASDV